ncbi:hypothetical protein MTO96_051846 [Rhipicephalus appendiculatus]
MAVGGWLGAGVESPPLHAYLEPSRGASTTSGRSTLTNRSRQTCHPDTPHKVRRSKATLAADMVRALSASLSAVCASVVTRTRSHFEHPSSLLRTASSSAVPSGEHHQRLQPRSSFNCQRRQRPQEQQQKRWVCGVGAEAPSRVDDGSGRMWCWTAWVPAVCAGVVAVLCYVNSLDGDFVHDDMVAVVGNPDVTGESRRRASSSSTSLWMNDFWGRPMADPRSHKSYRPLTVLSFR